MMVRWENAVVPPAGPLARSALREPLRAGRRCAGLEKHSSLASLAPSDFEKNKCLLASRVILSKEK